MSRLLTNDEVGLHDMVVKVGPDQYEKTGEFDFNDRGIPYETVTGTHLTLQKGYLYDPGKHVWRAPWQARIRGGVNPQRIGMPELPPVSRSRTPPSGR